MKLAYYARPIVIYNTEYQELDVKAIEALGFSILDITGKDTQDEYKKEGMAIFKRLISKCDVLFFRAQFNGMIGAGVVKEINWAKELGIPVFEIPNTIEQRAATVEQTRAYIKENSK